MARQTYKEFLKREQDINRLTYEGYGDPPLRQEPPRYAKKEATIQGLGTIFSCEHPDFKSSLAAIMRECSEVISLRDLAHARIKQGKYGILTMHGSFVREGSLFIPNKENKRILLRESLVLKDPGDYGCYEVAIDELFMPENFNVAAYLEQVGKDNYLILKDTSSVPADRLGEDERAVWLFQDQAKDYGLFLESNAETILNKLEPTGREIKIPKLNLLCHNTGKDSNRDGYIDAQPRPFANQLCLLGKDFALMSISEIACDSMGEMSGNRIRGLHREPAEGGAQRK